MPTQRDADGLALSSRNAYLSDEERAAARALPRALGEAAQAIADGAPVAEALDKARARLDGAGFDPIDYVELRDAETLAPMAALDRPARLLAAARIGQHPPDRQSAGRSRVDDTVNARVNHLLTRCCAPQAA